MRRGRPKSRGSFLLGLRGCFGTIQTSPDVRRPEARTCCSRALVLQDVVPEAQSFARAIVSRVNRVQSATEGPDVVARGATGKSDGNPSLKTHPLRNDVP